MNKFILSIVSATLFLILAVPAQASSSFGTARFFNGAWDTESWIFFGGCSLEDCANESGLSYIYEIGEFGVKQGVYNVHGPSIDPTRGRFVFKYNYKFTTEENAASAADKAIIKVKNVATDEVLYLKEVYPSTATDWQSVRFRLPNTHVQEELQWVFEVENDDTKVSKLFVSNIVAVHKDNPILTGKIYRWDDGVKIGIEGAKIKLKNKKKTKILKRTVSDVDGNFEFFPVKPNRRYRVVVKYKKKRRSALYRKAKFGGGSDKQIEFP